MTTDAGEVNICAFEDFRPGRPKVGLFSIAEAFEPSDRRQGAESSSLAAQHIDQANILDRYMIDPKITAPGDGDESPREGQFVFPVPIQAIIWLPVTRWFVD